MTADVFASLEVGARVFHMRGCYLATVEHRNEDRQDNGLPVYWAMSEQRNLMVMTRPDLWDLWEVESVEKA